MTNRSEHRKHKEKLQALLAVAGGAKSALILTHNDPDPDAIGSAFGLGYLLQRELDIKPTLAYNGIVGRAENRAMVEQLQIPLRSLGTLRIEDYDLLALLDSQPGAGNQPLTASRLPDIVLDHHPPQSDTERVLFADIRPDYAATSTIVAAYMRASRLKPNTKVATALFYGIRSDTLGLSRPSHDEDSHAYFYLQRYLERDALARIENASVTPAYYRAINNALENTTSYGNIVISRLGEMAYPDMAAEVADLLRRLDGATVVLAMGHYGQEVIVSLRSQTQTISLDSLVQTVIGQDGSAGGHEFMAAGRVPANLAGSAECTENLLVTRFLAALGASSQPPKSLLSSKAAN